MRPIFFLLCLSFTLPSVAQRFSAGLRTGTSYWPSTTQNLHIVEGNSGFSWEKAAYGRYESKGRFAFELNVAHSRFNYKHIRPNWDYFEGPPYEFLAHRSTTHVLTGNALTQFRVTNAQSKIRSYFGAGLSYGEQIEQHTFTVRYYDTQAVTERVGTDVYKLVFCGLNNYTSYTVNNHLNIHSAFSFDIDPFGALSSFYPAQRFIDSRFAWTIGCGYTF